MQIPSTVTQDSITVLTGSHGESSEDPSSDMEESDEDEIEDQYEMQFWDELSTQQIGMKYC